jgi:ABC-type proline/glycine betaine transport system ATPase subunit
VSAAYNLSGTFFLSLQKITAMKIKLKIDISKDGSIIKAGEIIEINPNNKDKWINKGWGEPVGDPIKKVKENKVKKETKELKIEKITKDEADQD